MIESRSMRWWVALAAGCWMLGIGLRMVVMGVFFAGQGWSYFPISPDILIDWGPMCVLGVLFVVFSLRDFYSSRKKLESGH